MSGLSKPYIKCEKRGGEYHLTVMKGGYRGHVLGGRAKVAVGDLSALGSKVVEMVDAVRSTGRYQEKQANGRS